MKTILLLLTGFAGISLMSSCYNDNLAEMTPSTVQTSTSGGPCDTMKAMSYNSDIVPILQNNCGTGNSCHSSSNTSGYDLSSYTAVYAVAVSGKLVSAIDWDGTVTPMPQGGSKMIDCNIAKIRKWVAAGAPNN